MKSCYYSHCHTPAVDGKASCQKHLDYAKKQAKKTRDQRIKNGLCRRCGQAHPAKDSVNCQKCTEHQKEYHERTKESTRMKNLQRKGLCYLCGKRPPEPGTYQGKPRRACAECNKKRNKKNLEKRLQGNRYKAAERDNFTCQLCESKKSIIIHHIDGMGDTSGYPNDKMDNLITLCRICHSPITLLRRDHINQDLACSLLKT